MPRPVEHSERYVPGLDGLRFVAVALVIGYHLDIPGFSGGLLGVGVFFTLSGYLITTNLMRSYLEKGTLRLGRFWLRRFRRLVPAMLSTVLVTMLLTVAFDAGNLVSRAWQALSTVFYVNNWYTIFAGESYFDRFTGPGPLSHMWSLAIEEQFYLVWPLILAFFVYVLRRRFLVIGATLLLGLGSFAWMAHIAEAGADNTRAYEGTDTRAGCLLLGVVLAITLAYRRHDGRSTKVSAPVSFVLGLVGLAGIIGMSVFVGRNSYFLYQGGFLLLTLASLAAMIAVLRTQGFWSRVLGCPPLRWLGECSYGIYLWHMPIIYFLPDSWPDVATASFTAVASVLLAGVSWSLFEDPIRRRGIIGPLRNWRADQQAALQPFALGSLVSMCCLVIIGVPAALGQNGAGSAGSTGSGPQNQAAMQPPQKTKTEARSGQPEREKESSSSEKSPQHDGGKTVCTHVVHVGDSTSIGMFDPEQLPAGAATADEDYMAVGADWVETSVFGARATTRGFDGNGENYPSALQSVKDLKAEGVPDDTCWVIATGVNDAANDAAARDGGYDTGREMLDNINEMLGELDGYRVMWSTAATGSPSNDYYDDANMQRFNEFLRKAAAKRDKVKVFDWAKEVAPHPDWFLEGDEVHYNATGNEERGKRFARGLAHAFPASDGGDADEPTSDEPTSTSTGTTPTGSRSSESDEEEIPAV